MDGLYFLAMLIGIVWLALWVAQSGVGEARFRSPFDMREPVDAAPDEKRRAMRRNTPAPAPGRRRGP